MPRAKQSNVVVPPALLAIKFDNNKKAIKTLEDENKKLRIPLEAYLLENGTIPNEESGHRVAILNHADVQVTLKHTHKVTHVLQPDAVEILKKNKLKEAIETVEVVREDVIERLYEEGKISDKVMSSLYAAKESDAFSVSVKGKFDESGI